MYTQRDLALSAFFSLSMFMFGREERRNEERKKAEESRLWSICLHVKISVCHALL